MLEPKWLRKGSLSCPPPATTRSTRGRTLQYIYIYIYIYHCFEFRPPLGCCRPQTPRLFWGAPAPQTPCENQCIPARGQLSLVRKVPQDPKVIQNRCFPTVLAQSFQKTYVFIHVSYKPKASYVHPPERASFSTGPLEHWRGWAPACAAVTRCAGSATSKPRTKS